MTTVIVVEGLAKMLDRIENDNLIGTEVWYAEREDKVVRCVVVNKLHTDKGTLIWVAIDGSDCTIMLVESLMEEHQFFYSRDKAIKHFS